MIQGNISLTILVFRERGVRDDCWESLEALEGGGRGKVSGGCRGKEGKKGGLCGAAKGRRQRLVQRAQFLQKRDNESGKKDEY